MTAARAAAADELAFSSLTGAAALLRAGKVSPVELACGIPHAFDMRYRSVTSTAGLH
jgi:hypothetical protein